MNKKACCGCFGVGCLLIIVAAVVGSVYGFQFLHETGREYAADGLFKSVEKITELAFNDADRNEINQLAAETAEEVRSGKIGLVDLLSKATRQLETNLHVQALLLAFYRQNKMSGEAGSGLPVDDEGSKIVKRLIFGMTENRISSDQIASITSLLVERYTETTGGEGKMKVTVSLQRLKTGMSMEELKKSLAMMKEVVDETGVESPDADFDATATVKSEFIQLFNGLREAAKKNAQ